MHKVSDCSKAPKRRNQDMACALCTQDKDLVASHIMPEFVHRPVYDKKHRANRFRHGDSRTELVQKGDRERLLCFDCDNRRIGSLERYFSQYWYHGNALPEQIPESGVSLSDLDYGLFKLFLLSLVWRASVSRSSSYKAADLGPHEDAIRRMLLSGDPGPPSKYCIYAGLIIDPGTRELWDEGLMAPVRLKVDGLWAYRIFFSGAAWTIVISQHRVPRIAAFCLTEKGELTLPAVPWQDFARRSGLTGAVRNLEGLEGA